MAGFKDFVNGLPLFESEIDGYLMRQTVMRFGTTTQLVNALTAGIREVGMMAWADNTGVMYMWDGANWIPWFSPQKTATLAFTAGGNQVTVSNAIVNTWWWYSGGMVKMNWRFVVGSTTNMQSGALSLALPIATRAELNQHVMGQATFFDTSIAVTSHFAAATLGTTTSIAFVWQDGTRWSTTMPGAFGVNDQLAVSLLYPPSTGTYL